MSTNHRNDDGETDLTDSEQRARDAALAHEIAKANDRETTVERLMRSRYGVNPSDHSTTDDLRQALAPAREERRERRRSSR